MNYRLKKPPDRILNIREVMILTTLSRSTLSRKSGRSFPAPIRLTAGGGRIGWREESVRLWLKDPTSWSATDNTQN